MDEKREIMESNHHVLQMRGVLVDHLPLNISSMLEWIDVSLRRFAMGQAFSHKIPLSWLLL
jgi:hypothetical protein